MGALAHHAHASGRRRRRGTGGRRAATPRAAAGLAEGEAESPPPPPGTEGSPPPAGPRASAWLTAGVTETASRQGRLVAGLLGRRKLDKAAGAGYKWLARDARAAPELALKAGLLDDPKTRAKVLASTGEPSRPAQLEAAELVLRHAAAEPCAALDTLEEPLEAAARAVQEDLVLMRRDPMRGNEYVLEAGCVCFSFGRLPERVGLPMRDVHRTVGAYAEDLRCPVDKLMLSLRAGGSVDRTNWALTWTDNLVPGPGRYPWRKTDTTEETAAEHAAEAAAWLRGRGVGDSLFLKVEYQTLRPLPVHGDYNLFTVRSLMEPLSEVPPAAAARLASQIRRVPSAFLEYKGLADEAVREQVMAFLDERATA